MLRRRDGWRRSNWRGAIGGVSSMGVPQTHTSNSELDVGWVYCDVCWAVSDKIHGNLREIQCWFPNWLGLRVGVLSQLFEQEMCCKFEDRNLLMTNAFISVSRPLLLAQSVSRHQSDSSQARRNEKKRWWSPAKTMTRPPPFNTEFSL